jgi:hypothetical protein
MSIKYGELTIMYDKEQTIFSTLLSWLKYEEHIEKNYKYIFLFDDGEICNHKDKFIDFNFYFCNSIISVMPLYFEKNNKKENNNQQTYFHKKIYTEKNKNYLLNFNKLFSLYSKYDLSMNINSDYNGIYYCHKNSLLPEIFGIIRIKSNEYMPRFQFAYDSDEFTKEEIIYLIHYIFNSIYLHK